MSETQPAKHSIGDEIPFRRDQIDKKTGSLVFDQHLGGAMGHAAAASKTEAQAAHHDTKKHRQVI